MLGIGEGLIVAQIVAIVYEDGRLRRYRRFVSIAVVGYALTTLIIDLQVKNLVNEYSTTFSYEFPSFYARPLNEVWSECTSYSGNSQLEAC